MSGPVNPGESWRGGGKGRRVGHVFTARVGRGEPTVPIGSGWSLIGWSVPETVYVSGRRGVPQLRPRGHMI